LTRAIAALLVLAACGGGDGGRGSAATSTTGAERVASTTTTTAPTTTTRDPVLGSGTPVTLLFAGDINFEGSLRTGLQRDPATVVGPFAPIIAAADVAVGNLETAITTGGTPEPKEFTFRAPPEALDALKTAGFDTVSMANNHRMDFGEVGLQDSLIARAKHPGFVIGIGVDEADAMTPHRATVGGQRIAVIAASQVIDDDIEGRWTAMPGKPGLASAKRIDSLVAAVRAARSDSDTVVVFLHWGRETETCPNLVQTRLAQTLVEAGADIVVGGHAHRLQGAGRLGGALVGYGLGNFLFGANSELGSRTGVLRVTVTGRRIDGYEWVPGRIVDRVPRPLEGPARDEAIAQWNALRDCTGLTP
jgi:poly-gamma-glutamate capsule biosynthesis protein CapA/YwtB (metallophosphatase superfamily)